MAKAQFTQNDVRKHLDNELKKIDRAIILRMRSLGERCVNHAREHGSYIDRTGNLRSSVGYVLLRHGKILDEIFESTGKGEEGVKEGKAFARMLADQYPTGYVLIVVAGMNYAAAVQSLGTNVLSNTEIFAKENFPRLISELKKSINDIKKPTFN